MKKYIKLVAFFGACLCLTAFVGCSSSNKKTVQASEKVEVTKNEKAEDDNKEEKKDSVEEKKEVSKEKENGIKYPSFEEDKNADDAKMVADNTNGLLKGTLHYPVRKDGKKVAYLTFDDGPSVTNTPKVLDILDKNNIKGTFFVTGKSLSMGEEPKKLLKEIVEKGHAIGNHTFSHDYKYLYPNRKMNVDNIMADLNKNDKLMKEILGDDFKTRVIRFPGGYWSWKERTPMKNKMTELGIQNIDWNALNADAEGKKKNATELLDFTKKSVEALGPNADSVVVLMHDTYGKEETVKALPGIIDYLKSKGFEFKSIK